MKRILYKSLVKIALPLVCVTAIFVMLWQGLRYAVVDDTESYSRVMMHEMYQQDNIDILFSGASLCFRSFNTSVLDEELQANTFNSASASQSIDVTYYLIQEIMTRNNVKHVFLDVGPTMAMAYHSRRQPDDMVSVYAIADYMKWSPRKIMALLRGSDPDYIINSFLPARRNWKAVFDPESIRQLLQKKGQSAYRQYGYEYLKHETEQYIGKGYVESDIRIGEGLFINAENAPDLLDDIDEGWFYYIDKIIDLCRNKGTEITLICTPLPDYTLALSGDIYDGYHERIKSIADETGVAFWDFICVKDEYMSTASENFMDPIHLNNFGADAFSRLFAKVVKGELTIEDITFSNMNERLSRGDIRVLGVLNSADGSRTIVTNGDGELEFKIKVTPSDKEEYILQEFSTNTKFKMPEDESGTFTVISREIGSDKAQRDYNYSY